MHKKRYIYCFYEESMLLLLAKYATFLTEVCYFGSKPTVLSFKTKGPLTIPAFGLHFSCYTS